MHDLSEVASSTEELRRAVLMAQPFRPLYVMLFRSYGCNLKCEMCNHWRETRQPPLSAECLQEVLHELAALGTRKIHLSGGEPMLRPQTPQLVQLAAALGMKVTMTTNGTLVTKEKAKQLVEAGLRGVNISIDSPLRKMHEKIRGVEGSFKAAVKAVELFQRYRHKGKLTIRLNTVVSRSNYTTLEALPDLAQRLGVDGINLIAVDDHCGDSLSMRKKDIALFNSEIAPGLAERALAYGLILSDEEAFPFGRSGTEIRLGRAGRYAFGYYDTRPCYAPWLHSLIDFNGNVYVCCMTRERIPPLGNVIRQSFTDIWTGAAYHRIRLSMHPPRLAPCQRCDDFVDENKRIWEMLGPY